MKNEIIMINQEFVNDYSTEREALEKFKEHWEDILNQVYGQMNKQAKQNKWIIDSCFGGSMLNSGMHHRSRLEIKLDL